MKEKKEASGIPGIRTLHYLASSVDGLVEILSPLKNENVPNLATCFWFFFKREFSLKFWVNVNFWWYIVKKKGMNQEMFG